MSKTVQVKMTRVDRTPWGFRLHGGADYGTPLIVQKVASQSPSESSGLQSGDVIIAVNGKDVSHCRHKEAQDTIVRAGNSFQLSVNRGGLVQQTWKPQVQAVGSMPKGPSGANQTFTKTSLKKPQAGVQWESTLDSNKAGSASNAEDFTKQFMSDMYGGSGGGGQTSNGMSAPVPVPTQSFAMPSKAGPSLKPGVPSPSYRTVSPTNKSQLFSTVGHPKINQYNNPAGLYSESNMKNAIEKRSETLQGGVRGMVLSTDKNPPVIPIESETLKLVRLMDASKETGDSFYGQGGSQHASQGAQGGSHQTHLSSQGVPQQMPQQGSNGPQQHVVQSNNTSSTQEVQSASFKLLQRALESDKEEEEEPVVDHDPNYEVPTNEAPEQPSQQQQQQEQPQEQPPTSPPIQPLPHAAPALQPSSPIVQPKLPTSGEPGGFRSVAAPITKPRPEGQTGPTGPQLSTCAICDRLITGVFLKAGGKPIHGECFNCATCNGPLKNKGHFHIVGKFYCDRCAPAAKAASMIGSTTSPLAQQHLQSQQQPPPIQPPFNQQQNRQPLVNQQQSNFQQSNQSSNQWNRTLNENKAGAASNAEDFTKQFMSDMFGGSKQQQQMQKPSAPMVPSAPAPAPAPKPSYALPVQQPQRQVQAPLQQSNLVSQTSSSSNEWSRTLDSNRAGAASNAQDFTKQFMSDMFGGGGSSNMGGGSAPAPKPILKQPQFQPQQQRNTSMSSSSSMQMSSMSTSSNMANSSGSGNQTYSSPQTSLQQQLGPGQNLVSPRRGKGVLKQSQAGMRIPNCGACNTQIRGPFITALGKTWCPNHFACNQQGCGRNLQDVGFVEEKGMLYCEECYGKYLAPDCEKCRKKIIGNCLKAMQRTFHPECFVCAYCGKIFSNSPFYLEDGLPYCDEDWNELFTTKCVSCGFPIEAGDRWVEALNNNYHSQCFNCTLCKKNLEGQGFFVKAGKPFCKSHARG